MSRVFLSGSPLRGTVIAPPSKSAAHRALICAALGDGRSVLSPFAPSADMTATIGGLRALGAEIQETNGAVIVDGIFRHGQKSGLDLIEPVEIDCIESGSTVRFLIPLAAALGASARFTGRGRLPERPLDLFSAVLSDKKVTVSAAKLPLSVSGQLQAGKYLLPGDISSQYISGFLMALPLLPGDSEIQLTTPLESANYVDMTLSVMADFGIRVEIIENGWRIPGGQRYRSGDYIIEGDWSQAAFFLAAGAIGGDVTVAGLRRDSLQGDRRIESLLVQMGASMDWTDRGLRAKAAHLHGIDIDCSQIPDLLPILAATASVAEGETRLHSAARVRLKESDRIAVSAAALERLGIETVQDTDSLTIFGGSPSGAQVDGANDHRIVMAFSILGSRIPGISVTDAKAIGKSYKAFFEDYNRLGGGARLEDE